MTQYPDDKAPFAPSSADGEPPSYSAHRDLNTKPPSPPQMVPFPPAQDQFQPLRPHYHFPTEWSLFGSAFEATLVLGADLNHPVYAVSQNSGWTASPDLVLHAGPNTDTPALASAANDSSLGNSASNKIVLPALDAYSSGGATKGVNVVTELLEAAPGWTNSMLFSIEVGPTISPSDPSGPPPPSQLRREQFEWRHTRGDAVNALGQASYGYKLVRLSNDPPPPPPPSSSAGAAIQHGSASKATKTSKGQEVVAVFARGAAAWGGGDGGKTRMKFRYLGCGATGALGERWMLMAAITAIRIWQREQRQRKMNS